MTAIVPAPEKDLAVTSDTVPICLKCKVCKVEEHMTLQEFLDKHRDNGGEDLRCRICPDSPVLYVYKADMRSILRAGFNHGMREERFSKDEMLEYNGIFNTLFKEEGNDAHSIHTRDPKLIQRGKMP